MTVGEDGAEVPFAVLADALIGASSSSTLLNRLEDLVHQLRVVPVRLYLIDNHSCTFFPVAAFGCEGDGGELGIDEVLLDPKPGYYCLYEGGDPVGLLTATITSSRQADAVRHLCQLLGPVLVEVHEQERIVDALRRAHERINHFMTAGQLLKHIDLDVLLVEILQTALKSLDAQVGAILTGNAGKRMSIRVTWGLREDHVEAIRLRDGRRVVDAVAEQRHRLCLMGQEIDDNLDVSRLDAVLTGLLVLPLDTDGACHGVILLGNPSDTFDQDSERLAQTVCHMAAIALENALLVTARIEQERLSRELDIARTVQADMFPRGGLEVDGIRIEGAFRSCEETGGDYLTYLQRDDKLVAMIGDVTGHGLGAALFTMAAHAIVQQQLRTGVDLADALTALNTGLHSTHGGRFMTTALIEIDPATDSFVYASAGHNPLLWLHEGHEEWLPSHGLPLGILDTVAGECSDPMRLSPGDTVILYTDGFTEAFDPQGECFGEAQFAGSVRSGLERGLRGTDLIDHLFARLDAWTGGAPPTDDLTIIVVHYRLDDD